MSLELGSRFRLPDGRLVEVVPDIEKILGIATEQMCKRCAGLLLHVDYCIHGLGCGVQSGSMLAGLPRILKEVENEP